MPERPRPKTLRCAIYTRKSSEEGLEQDFNSLHAQREACEAYIVSQRHEGWTALPAAYDDGGYSGGSIERPGLQKLLADIATRLVDVVVVYKVDRLTRSLADFAKIVEVFDAQGVSFVSVTQQFNTTTSMGRLTLNVLLSFAQFEREVTGERIRDKIAASKKKGMWMGGWVPIGYDAKDRTLVINEAEANTLRTIFQLYTELKNVRLLQAELHRRKLTTKRYVARTGRAIGGLPFSRGHIYRILSNPIYIGEIDHKGTRHPGEHPAIIGRETWEAVYATLKANGSENRTRSNCKDPSLLAGLLFDESCNRLTPTHATRNGKRYRYYVSKPAPGRTLGDSGTTKVWIAASEIEPIVLRLMAEFLGERSRLVDSLGMQGVSPGLMARALAAAKELVSRIETRLGLEQRDAIAELTERVVVGSGTIRLELNRRALIERLFGSETDELMGESTDEPITIEAHIEFGRRGTETKFVIEGNEKQGSRSAVLSIIKAVARGHMWFDDLVTGRVESISELAKGDGVTDRYVSQLIEIAFLPPAIVESILAGRQPADLSFKNLAALIAFQRINPLPAPPT
jgi:DNA invertase Pin-like site-specific DNA recombinase